MMNTGAAPDAAAAGVTSTDEDDGEEDDRSASLARLRQSVAPGPAATTANTGANTATLVDELCTAINGVLASRGLTLPRTAATAAATGLSLQAATGTTTAAATTTTTTTTQRVRSPNSDQPQRRAAGAAATADRESVAGPSSGEATVTTTVTMGGRLLPSSADDLTWPLGPTPAPPAIHSHRLLGISRLESMASSAAKVAEKVGCMQLLVQRVAG
jgi:hypothetical protein